VHQIKLGFDYQKWTSRRFSVAVSSLRSAIHHTYPRLDAVYEKYYNNEIGVDQILDELIKTAESLPDGEGSIQDLKILMRVNSAADFFGAMADAAGDPRILPAMQSFTDQQGVPLVTFAPAGKGKWTATQSRYVRLGTQAPDQTWGVPLCLRQGDARACELLVDKTATVSIDGKGALMPNAGGTGYYRFELPAAQWDALIAQGASLPGGEAARRLVLEAFDTLAEEIERRVRAFNPWPGAYTFWKGALLKIWKALPSPAKPLDAPPGLVFQDEEGVKVVCGEGALVLKEVQPAGKKRMPVDDFIRGRKEFVGAILG